MKQKTQAKPKQPQSKSEPSEQFTVAKIHGQNTNTKTNNSKQNQVDKQLIKEKLKKMMAQKPHQGSLESFLKPQLKQKSTEQDFLPMVQPTLHTKPGEVLKGPEGLTRIQEEKSVSSQWLQKIKGIKSIRGYEVKNTDVWYDVEVWDKNGQTFFVPPLVSQTVRGIDQGKLASFLQDCLLRGWQQERAMERE